MFGERQEQEFQKLFHKFQKDTELSALLRRVQYEELFSYKFLAENSEFSSLDDILFRSGFGILSPLEIKNVSQEKWDAYIAKHTKCEKWHEFGKLAMTNWMNNVLKERKEERKKETH